MKSSPQTVHILNQFAWPDGAPTGIYAEQLAVHLHKQGHRVRLIAGKGAYRTSERECPEVKPVLLDHFTGKRGNLWHELGEYFSLHRAFASYLKSEVAEGDLVIISSAPPLTINLHRLIRKQKALGIYWLQDYYPELLRTIFPLPLFWNPLLKAYWNHHLRQWDHIVKIAANLGYQGNNTRIIRNWATLTFDPNVPFQARTALYAGNLGYAHDTDTFITLCEQLRKDGYRIKVRGDGIGINKLPDWINTGPSFRNENELREACLSAEVLLVAADPRIRHALFPSKIWNYLATGRSLSTSGFEGAMEQELEITKKTDPYEGLKLWGQWLEQLLGERP